MDYESRKYSCQATSGVGLTATISNKCFFIHGLPLPVYLSKPDPCCCFALNLLLFIMFSSLLECLEYLRPICKRSNDAQIELDCGENG